MTETFISISELIEFWFSKVRKGFPEEYTGTSSKRNGRSVCARTKTLWQETCITRQVLYVHVKWPQQCLTLQPYGLWLDKGLVHFPGSNWKRINQSLHSFCHVHPKVSVYFVRSLNDHLCVSKRSLCAVWKTNRMEKESRHTS